LGSHRAGALRAGRAVALHVRPDHEAALADERLV
jgi:hypothetical protein